MSAASNQDRDILLLAMAGDRAALAQLMFAEYDTLHEQVAARMQREGTCGMSVDDVLQQTFIRAAQAIGRFEERDSSFGGWLATIATNLVRDAQRRTRRELREPAAAHNDGEQLALLPEEITSPSMQVQRVDATRLLRDAIDQLPAEQREVIERHYLQHQSLDQIAIAIDRTKGAVRGICYRARQALRLALGHSSLFFSS